MDVDESPQDSDHQFDLIVEPLRSWAVRLERRKVRCSQLRERGTVIAVVVMAVLVAAWAAWWVATSAPSAPSWFPQ